MQPDSDSLDATGGWSRLHPLSPLVRAGRVAVVVAVLALQNLGENQVQGQSGPPLTVVVAGIVAFAALVGAYAYVSWRMTGFRVRGQELEVRSGVLLRSHRNVPLARVETVDIRRPILARLLGLSEVRVEVVSTGASEVKLQYLGETNAVDTRARLAELVAAATGRAAVGSGAAAAAGCGAAAGSGVPPVRPILQVPNREIVVWYLLPLLALVIPWFGAVSVGAALRGTEGAVQAGGLAIFLLFGAAPFVFGIEKLLQFRLGESDDALHVERGLLNHLAQRVVLGRVQAIRIEEPLIWRAFGRARLTVDVAGYRGGGRESATETAVLLPVGPRAAVDYLLDRLPEAERVEHLDYRPLPARARWRSPLRWRTYSVAVTPVHTVVRCGLLRKRTELVPHHKLQSVRLTQGPWQRALDLATLHLDTAGSQIKTKARHRPCDEARALTEQVLASR